jgi:hypothetical protein
MYRRRILVCRAARDELARVIAADGEKHLAGSQPHPWANLGGILILPVNHDAPALGR